MPGSILNRRLFLLGCTALAGCQTLPPSSAGQVRREEWGRMPDGDPVYRFTLTNRRGSSAAVMTYGAAVTSLHMPDRAGRHGEVVLGLDDFEAYRTRSRNFGTLVGRYAGRIANGRFPLDGRMVQLETGSSRHSSHGGPVGFAKRNWQGEAADNKAGPAVRFSLISADGDQGFPGTLSIQVTYCLTDDDRLALTIEATTSAPTVLNPTHHGYFNLGYDHSRPVHDHLLRVEADGFTAFGPDKLVTGEIRPVAGTALDFRVPKPIGRDIGSSEEQMRIGNGYDHCFVIRGRSGDLRQAARVLEPQSGRVLELWTTEPGVQFFTANSVDMPGRNGVPYRPHCGFCLEPQHFQDSPNRPEFPSTLLRPGQTFRSHSEYRFSTYAV